MTLSRSSPHAIKGKSCAVLDIIEELKRHLSLRCDHSPKIDSATKFMGSAKGVGANALKSAAPAFDRSER